MKILKTKKVNIALCWSGLKNIPPKDFPSIGEIDATMNILDILKEDIPNFVAMIKEGDKLNVDMQSGKFSAEEMIKMKTEFIKKSNLAEEKESSDVIEISFENADFNTFFQQFERWGKNWFFKLEQYIEFRKDMNLTNSQSKVK